MTDKPTDTIAAGLTDEPGGGRVDLRRGRRIAADFRPDPLYERLLAWRDEGSQPRWDDVAPTTQIACGLYEHQRQVARDHGLDTTLPATDDRSTG